MAIVVMVMVVGGGGDGGWWYVLVEVEVVMKVVAADMFDSSDRDSDGEQDSSRSNDSMPALSLTLHNIQGEDPRITRGTAARPEGSSKRRKRGRRSPLWRPPLETSPSDSASLHQLVLRKLNSFLMAGCLKGAHQADLHHDRGLQLYPSHSRR